MCHHVSFTIRTRRITCVDQANSHGTGEIRTIEHVKAIADDVYQGTFRDGTPWTIDGSRIRARPKMYRLRKERGHRDCYQLVITQVERYRQLEGEHATCGPMQRDMPNRATKVYKFSDGQSVTNLALNQTENLREYEVVTLPDPNGKSTRRYLRETHMVGTTKKLPTTYGQD
ncbi:hypothetical protein E4T42_01182 [Aureobasidium subglaciale]|nr:hypothetical protein E4T42_01182 [Aureobasidium subglaciale]